MWVQENGLLKRIDVRLGLADATNTELIGDTLEPGTSVVTGVTLGAAAPATTPAASSESVRQPGPRSMVMAAMALGPQRCKPQAGQGQGPRARAPRYAFVR